MKKIILVSLLMLGLVGCSSTNTEVPDLKVTKIEKAEVLTKAEYILKMEDIKGKILDIEKYKKVYEYKSDEDSKQDSINKLDSIYRPERDMYRDMVQSISKFRSDDDMINNYHDKLIAAYTEAYNLAAERYKVSLEVILESEETGYDKTQDKWDMLYKKIDIVDKMLYEQISNADGVYIELKEIMNIN